MKKKKLIIIGAGGHSRVVVQEILKNNQFQIIGFVDDKIKNNKDYNIIGNLAFFIKKFKNKKINLFCAIGDIKSRLKIIKKIEKNKIKVKWAKIISKDAKVFQNVKIGDGTLVVTGSIININSTIGKHSIINTNASIDHDCRICDFVNISPGVSIAGYTTINNNSFIGIGASIKERIIIENNVTIGANSFVNKNCKKEKTYFGSPIKLYKNK